MNRLEDYGWNSQIQTRWKLVEQPGLIPARVTADFGTSLSVVSTKNFTAELSGKLAHYSHRDAAPKVGDWVGLRVSDNGHATIEFVIPRLNEIARKVSGKQAAKQVIAANIDIAFLLLALDNDFSVDRVRRFLYQLSIYGIKPVIVLNKADKTDDIDMFRSQLSIFKLPIVTTTAITGKGIAEIAAHIVPAHTGILLGSSGVGKSTITNYLLGREAQKTQEIRSSDDTGKHTTVHRELFMLNNGGLLIDTPGIRELQLWGTDHDLKSNFDDIVTLISTCLYTSCQHGVEEGCSIQKALNKGTLDKHHYDAFQKMKRELNDLHDRAIVSAKRENSRSRHARRKLSQLENHELRNEIF